VLEQQVVCPIVYSNQEVIVEKVLIPENSVIYDARAMFALQNGDVLVVDHSRQDSFWKISNLEAFPIPIPAHTKSRLKSPIGVWVDDNETIIIANTYANEVIALGAEKDTILLGDGNLNGPRGLFMDSHKNLFVCDGKNNRILKLSPEGQVSQVNNKTQPITFNLPTGLCVLSTGEVIVADCENNCIQKIDLNGDVRVIAGTPSERKQGGHSDIEPTKLSWPYNVKAMDRNLIFVEAINNVVRVILSNGKIVTLKIDFAEPVMYMRGLTIDRNYNIYISGVSNRIYRLRSKPKIELAILLFTLYANENIFQTLPKELMLMIIEMATLYWGF
jgi:hypothetical protein